MSRWMDEIIKCSRWYTIYFNNTIEHLDKYSTLLRYLFSTLDKKYQIRKVKVDIVHFQGEGLALQKFDFGIFCVLSAI